MYKSGESMQYIGQEHLSVSIEYSRVLVFRKDLLKLFQSHYVYMCPLCLPVFSQLLKLKQKRKVFVSQILQVLGRESFKVETWLELPA